MSITKRVCASVEKKTADLLKIVAIQEDKTINEIIRDLINQYLEKYKDDESKSD